MVEMYPFWWARTIGGVIFLAGVLVFIINLFKSFRNGEAVVLSGATAEGRA